jgi:uncharacterized protein YdaT
MSNAAAHKVESSNGHPDVVRQLGVRVRKDAIEDIAEALKSSGYRSLDQQANALDLHRATAWTIIRNKHKIGRLSRKTIYRILTNPNTPPAVLVVVERYVERYLADD